MPPCTLTAKPLVKPASPRPHLSRSRNRCLPDEPTTPVLADIPEPGRPSPRSPKSHPPAWPPTAPTPKLSTGPSEAGRAISSQNRLTHGLARHNGVFKVLTCEDPLGFEALKQRLAEEHQPTTATEAILVNTMAESTVARRTRSALARYLPRSRNRLHHRPQDVRSLPALPQRPRPQLPPILATTS